VAKPSKKVTPPDESEAFAAQIVEMMLTYGRAQFSDAVKSYWSTPTTSAPVAGSARSML
jgi:hypothetical protein